MLPQLNIQEYKQGVESVAIIDGRHWQRHYGTIEAALHDAELLDMIDSAAPHISEYRAEPLGYSFFAQLPEDFDVTLLRANGWTAVAHRIIRTA